MREAMKRSRLFGIVFLVCLVLCLATGKNTQDAEPFEAVRVADKLVSTMEAALTFEAGSVLNVSVTDIDVGPVQKIVSPMDVIMGRVRYRARVSVIPQLESEKHVVKAKAFVFDAESESVDGIQGKVNEEVASLVKSIRHALQVKGYLNT